MMKKLVHDPDGVEISIRFEYPDDGSKNLLVLRDTVYRSEDGTLRISPFTYTRSLSRRDAAGLYALRHSLRKIDKKSPVTVYTDNERLRATVKCRKPEKVPANMSFPTTPLISSRRSREGK